MLSIKCVSVYLSQADVLVPKDFFKHAAGLKLRLENEFPGVTVRIKAANIPRPTADQINLPPDHPVRSRHVGKPLPGTTSPETETDFLLTELQKVIDAYCKSTGR